MKERGFGLPMAIAKRREGLRSSRKRKQNSQLKLGGRNIPRYTEEKLFVLDRGPEGKTAGRSRTWEGGS